MVLGFVSELEIYLTLSITWAPTGHRQYLGVVK